MPRFPGEDQKGPTGTLFAGGALALHACVAMVLGPIVTVVAVVIARYVFENVLAVNSVLKYGDLANPCMWAPGIVLGFVVNRNTPERMACWVWLVGLVWLAVGIWDLVHNYDAPSYHGCSAFETVVNTFFVADPRRCGGGEFLEGVFFTMPAISSVAYAVGTWVATRLAQKRSEIV